VIPVGFIPAVQKGGVEAAQSGLIGGQEMTDVEVELVDGSTHPIDSSELAFKNARFQAFREATKRAGLRAARAGVQDPGGDAGRKSR
jgi:elongation factor G